MPSSSVWASISVRPSFIGLRPPSAPVRSLACFAGPAAGPRGARVSGEKPSKTGENPRSRIEVPERTMSVERIQLLHEDYIRLTERFKALWTFHQFLRGVYKTFFSTEPGYALDFNALYDEVRAIAAQINTGSPETVEPLIRELYTRLDGVSSQLREVDRKISPSFVRRFFEKVRPQDEKIAFYLLRFYFSQSEIDEDVIDKVDFLATVAATGRSDPDAGATRPRAQIKKLFEALTSASIWPRLDTAMTPAIVRAFDELATDVSAAREFEELLTQRLLEN